ncbi:MULTISPECIES: GNAT family N-acetyltransferase [Saccharothrix]|uniref:GNAT family N-acetyltransferase n=1 Tax=Saccharothrix TaxID=2071 RepID=UPI00093C9A34|nr:GNAT family N-acetyltransferase [Saccharothrix sp. CB00851]OKI29024.1 GCN5 family acetyltransferase [Saccharothrix sp. CB00851]
MRIREGDLDDLSAIMAMLDGAVAWLDASGRTGQWGSEPFSDQPGRVEGIAEKIREGAAWIAEVDGTPAGAMTLAPNPPHYVRPAAEPEVYVTLLVTSRSYAGMGVGSALLAHAREETRRAGVELLRVDCYAGSEGKLVDYYRRNGFEPTEPFTVGEWPGQVLAQRVRTSPE